MSGKVLPNSMQIQITWQTKIFCKPIMCSFTPGWNIDEYNILRQIVFWMDAC